MKNKRKFPRLNEKWKLTYRVLEEDQFLKGPIQQYTLNISGGGISFASENELRPGMPVALELEAGQFPAPVLALANVVWCERKKQMYEIGAEFWWVGWKNDNAGPLGPLVR